MTHQDYRAACERADAAMKQTNGHAYETILKTRCTNCGKSPKVTTKCGGWFMTFLNCLESELSALVSLTPVATKEGET